MAKKQKNDEQAEEQPKKKVAKKKAPVKKPVDLDEKPSRFEAKRPMSVGGIIPKKGAEKRPETVSVFYKESKEQSRFEKSNRG